MGSIATGPIASVAPDSQTQNSLVPPSVDGALSAPVVAHSEVNDPSSSGMGDMPETSKLEITLQFPQSDIGSKGNSSDVSDAGSQMTENTK